MILNSKTKLSEFFLCFDALKIENRLIDDLFDKLKEYHLTDKLNISFNTLKFRQLIDLQSRVQNFNDIIFVSLEVVHGIPKKKALDMSAFDCIKFALHTKDELERITKLFKNVEYKPTSEELRAGINNLSHGFFGTIDWYARRMGITDHDEVVELNWTTIYQCLKIDFDNNKFERNYRQIINKQNK